MSLKEAKKYIDELHKKQGNPYIWPDFLTGLPDKAAILLRLDEIYPRMGEYAISLVRIANVNPYRRAYRMISKTALSAPSAPMIS